jgi:hypothetical protein
MDDMPKLGEYLIRRKLITRQQLETALKIQENNDGRPGSILLSLRYITRQKIEANLPDIR